MFKSLLPRNTYLLTPWSRVLLEKLTGFAANQEIPLETLPPGDPSGGVFYRRIVLSPEEASRPTPKLEDHPLSAVRNCLFDLFAATLHIGGRSSIRNLRTRYAVVTGTHKHSLTKEYCYEYNTVACFKKKKLW